MERRVVRGQWLRRGDDQLPRLDRLRTEVYRLDQRRLGRQTVRRSDEGTRLRGEDIPVHRQEPRDGAGRELRRLHGELDPRSHEPIQMHRVARWNLQYRVCVRYDGRALVSGMGIQRATVEESRAVPEIFTALVRRQIQNADAGGSRSE